MYAIDSPVVIYVAFSMTAKIMSLYSTTKGKVKSRRKIDGELRLKMQRFSEFEKEHDLGMFNSGALYNVLARYFNVHRTIV